MDMPIPDTLSLRRLSPHLGAEVEGLDITRPLHPEQVATLRAALGQHGVLFFRGQHFDFESQKRFGRYFGALDIHPNTPGPEGHPEILPIHADASSKVIAGERWHSVAFWDNRAVQHLAIWDYFLATRSGARVTVKGERLVAP